MHQHNHIIQKQLIEIGFENPGHAIGVQNRIAEIYYEKLMPQLEVLFDELVGENYLARIDCMKIDCGVLTDKNWEEQWVQSVLTGLRQELREMNKKPIEKNTVKDIHPAGEAEDGKEDHHTADSFFYFLEYGYLPWNNRIGSLKELEAVVSIKASFIRRLNELFSRSNQAAERLATQFSKELRKRITVGLTTERKEELDEILSLVKINNIHAEQHLIESKILLVFSAEGNNPVLEFFTRLYHDRRYENKHVIEKILQQVKHKKEDPQFANSQPGPTIELRQNTTEPQISGPDTIYISNAGLVIVHPFLPELFEQLQLTEKNAWIDKAAQHAGVFILEHIVRGESAFPEFNLPLNKILCGMSMDEVMLPATEMNDATRSVCDNLIRQIIYHWDALKNTGIESFRETFLQRSAKLTRVDNGWLMQVEQKGVDVLVGRLPWGIGTTRLPWMKELLFTEW